jgi:L-idonate 5-dehydrogenase
MSSIENRRQKMKAVVVQGSKDLRVEEIPMPSPAPGEVLVKMEWGGICGSDISYWKYGRSGTAVLKNPMILGHEGAGVVIEVGAEDDSDLLGTAVTFQPATLVGDGIMPDRLAGRTNIKLSVKTKSEYCLTALIRESQLLQNH